LDAFEKIYIDGVYVIAVNISRSTIKEAYEFRKVIEEEISSGHTNLVIDLSKCDNIDSTFFGGIIWAYGKLSNIGKKLKIVKYDNPKEDIFMTTKTFELFDLFETREDAIKSFMGNISSES
jgi:anti-anti-sigma factor